MAPRYLYESTLPTTPRSNNCLLYTSQSFWVPFPEVTLFVSFFYLIFENYFFLQHTCYVTIISCPILNYTASRTVLFSLLNVYKTLWSLLLNLKKLSLPLKYTDVFRCLAIFVCCLRIYTFCMSTRINGQIIVSFKNSSEVKTRTDGDLSHSQIK